MSKKSSDLSSQEIVQQIFQHFKINTVINIDDIYEDNISVEKIIGLVTNVISDGNTVEISNIDFSNPDTIWIEDIRNYWNTIDKYEKENIYHSLENSIDRSDIRDEDKSVSTNLEKYLHIDGIEFIKCPPSEWETIFQRYVAVADEDNKVLCLFDQDLSFSPGRHEESGILLLKNALKHNNDFTMFGLLTHRIADIKNETVEWKKLASKYDLPLDRFLPLAKKRLNDDVPELTFADGIKKTVLNMHYEKIKKHMGEILIEANESATNEFSKLDVYDFDHMVMKSSYGEGIWEIDTLFRLYQIFQRDSLREKMFSNGGKEINRLIHFIRPVGNISIPYDLSPSVSKIRHNELFESSEIICNTPLQTGDIFRLEVNPGEPIDYILLAQPCDLIVRGDGKRSINNLLVPLVPIGVLEGSQKLNAYDNVDKQKKSYWSTHDYIYYYHENINDVAILAFKKTALIDVRVLELAVINSEDKCYFDTNTALEIPKQLPVGWQSYSQQIVEAFKNESKTLDSYIQRLELLSADNNEDKSIKEALMMSLMHKYTLSFENLKLPGNIYNSGIFDFRMRRVKRYREPYATRLLKSYTRFLSRDAEDHDFAKT